MLLSVLKGMYNKSNYGYGLRLDVKKKKKSPAQHQFQRKLNKRCRSTHCVKIQRPGSRTPHI